MLHSKAKEQGNQMTKATRSDKGEQFHNVLFAYILNSEDIVRNDDGTISERDSKIVKLKEILGCKRPELKFLAEKDKNGSSLLQEIIFFCFEVKTPDRKEKLYSADKAEELALFLLQFITENNWWRVASPETRKEAVLATGGGLSLLQTAVNSNSVAVLEKIDALCKETLSPDEYQNLLQYQEANGNYSIINSAENKSDLVFLKTLRILKEGLPAEIFKGVINNKPNERYGLLAHKDIVSSQSKFLAMLECDLTRETLLHTVNGTNILHQVARFGNQEMYQKIVEKIVDVCGHDAFIGLLNSKSNSGYTPIGSAATNNKSNLVALMRGQLARARE